MNLIVGWRRSARYWLPAFWPLALGVAWITYGALQGAAALILGLVAGTLPLAAGAGALIWGLDRMIIYHMAIGGVIGLPGGLLGFALFPPGVAAILTLAAVGVLILAGWGGLFLWQAPTDTDAMPRIRLAPHAAPDCALMGFYVHCSVMPDQGDFQARIAELESLEDAVGKRSFNDISPVQQPAPSAPASVDIQPLGTRRVATEWLTFESTYEPDPDFPGASRWHGYRNNGTVACRLLRHDDKPRPWLVCVHGYRMGSPLDLAAFDAERLHRQFGVNICMPILPLHGPRRATRLTGGLFLDGPLVNIWHAVGQSLADTRQCVAWLRATQSPSAIGVFGLSLGGYTAALLAAAEQELSPVIAAIPMVEIAPTLWQHMPEANRSRMMQAGFDANRVNRILGPVSPLAHAPPAGEGTRAILAANADQIIPPDQPRALWQHWGAPPIYWSDAGHLSIQHRADARAFVDRHVDTMQSALPDDEIS